jgi:N-acetylmuramoyl-L-alanine amidase
MHNNKKLVIICLLIFTFVFGIASNAFAASIYYGSDSASVKQVQQKLKNWGYYDGAVDGIFGIKTEKAVRWFQSKNGLTVDGKCGKETLTAMGLTDLISKSTSSGGTNYSDDVYLLARCIYGEGRGEPYTGQVAIAAVILNRVEDSGFPNSISGVIYQKGAFDAVSDGQINLTPNQSALNAAKDAMNGWDPSGGAIYYYNPETATNKWIRSRPIIVTIGKHVFCK